MCYATTGRKGGNKCYPWTCVFSVLQSSVLPILVLHCNLSFPLLNSTKLISQWWETKLSYIILIWAVIHLVTNIELYPFITWKIAICFSFLQTNLGCLMQIWWNSYTFLRTQTGRLSLNLFSESPTTLEVYPLWNWYLMLRTKTFNLDIESFTVLKLCAIIISKMAIFSFLHSSCLHITWNSWFRSTYFSRNYGLWTENYWK